MKVLINSVSDLLNEKLSLHQRGLLITIILLKDKDQRVWHLKVKDALKHREDFNLATLHKRNLIEWMDYEKYSKKKDYSRKFNAEIEETIDFFNKLTGKSLDWTKETQTKLLRARLDEGYTVAQIKSVIANRYEEWKDNSEMAKHLYPTTIFRPSKFPKYLEEVKRTKVGTAIVQAKAIGLKHGDEITLDNVDSFVDKDTYNIRTYRVDGEGRRLGAGFKGTRYGKDIKSSIKLQERNLKYGEPKEFIYTYLEK